MHVMKKEAPKIILADNKKARFDYEIVDSFEAGIELFGEEVRSIRNGSANLKGSYALIQGNHVSLVGMHIGEWKWAMRKIEPKRERSLLIKKDQIFSLSQKIKTMGATLVPLEVYTKWNLIKLHLGLVRGRKKWEKKQVMKERDLEREIKQLY